MSVSSLSSHFQKLSLQQGVIDIKELEFQKNENGFPVLLGKGSFGKVYKAKWHYQDVAVKKLDFDDHTKDALEEFFRETSIMSQLSHENIVRLFRICKESPNQYSMVMEFMEGGSLFHLLHQSNQDLNWYQLYKIALDIAKGLYHLHSQKIRHRDLKTLNVLLNKHLQAKITDFGLSKIKKEVATNSTMGMVGTFAWMAPELFMEGGKSTEKSDIYSFGMILWEISSRRPPFAGINQFTIPSKIMNGEREPIPEGTPPLFAQLIQRCWQQDPEKRPNIHQVMQDLMNMDSYFTSINTYQQTTTAMGLISTNNNIQKPNIHQVMQDLVNMDSYLTSINTYQQTTTAMGLISTNNNIQKPNIQLKGELSKIAGIDNSGFDNSSMQNAMFNFPYFLKYKQSSNKLYIVDQGSHIIRSITNISMNNNDYNDKWNGELKIEVGQPKQEGYCNGDRNTCKLRYPMGFDWDMNDDMYICNWSCICKVDSKSNQVSLVAGHANVYGYKNGNNDEAIFNCLAGVICYQLNYQSPLELYVCDYYNHCIRMIDVTNGKTTTFAGKGEVYGDVDGTLQSARFNCPHDIVKDDENDNILYVSDFWNHKIKMIDMEKGMVTTLVGDKNDTSILNYPRQMQIIDSFIYVACSWFYDCIVKIDKHSKQVTWIKFNGEKQVSSDMYGITYHELDQCFYISDKYNIYKLE